MWPYDSKAVLFLLFYVICVSCMPCCLVCSLQPCGYLQGKGSSCVFVNFPYDVLGQVWYLNVSIPDICLILTMFTIQQI